MMEICISVRNLVEFLLRSGDLDNRRIGAPADAMLEGGRIHRMIQRRMGSEYEAEVLLKTTYDVMSASEHDERQMPIMNEIHDAIEYRITVEGRADGIITDHTGVTIDEIKGTYRDLSRLKKPQEVHLAQAKCYAYMYGMKEELDSVRVRMTYCNIDTEELKYFHEEYSMDELKLWFEAVMEEYKKWADFQCEWNRKRQKSIEALEFPFPYREGQKELVTYVYQTIYHKKKLFLEAPTGVGKTISTVFPSIKAMGTGRCEKLFYLTAKTITRTVAEQAFQLLREKGLQFKSVILTAKDKICFMEETECNPEYCPYAKGHYDRINDAVYDLLTHTDSFDRDAIEEYAQKHHVCPFELCLDMSLFSDGVICDYNYVFDPHVYLKRFFAEGAQGNYIFLVDEAHNLLDRGREMYSASLTKEQFLEMKKLVKPLEGRLEKQIGRHLEKCNKELLLFKRQCENCELVEEIDDFVNALTRLSSAIDNYFDECDESPIRAELLDFFFEISHFLDIYERVDDNYVKYTQMQEDGSFLMKLFCVNPAKNLQECMMRARSTILFSATLLPIQYYKKLLGGEKEDYEVYAHSVFRPEKKALFIGKDVTSRYTRRCEEEYYNIACYLYEVLKNRHGNYMAFFPSHSFLQAVYEQFMEHFGNTEEIECILQEDYMNETAREGFLARFEGNEDCDLNAQIHMEIELEEEKSLLGFCVMGGIFSEGIDLKKDSLIGALIIGTGIPQVCNEREILKNYFNASGENGFDYAYRYPGMNKVLQAAGRVIRTAEDVGVVVLLDERFLSPAYQKLFPRDWTEYEVVTVDKVARRVERFWDEWL